MQIGDSFEQLIEAVFEQQRRREELEAENSELRHSIAELRSGRSIVVDILGTQFTLVAEEGEGSEPHQEALSLPELEPVPVEFQPTIEVRQVMPVIPQTPQPDTDRLQKLNQAPEPEAAPVPAVPPSSLLEEMLVNEFSAAATGSMTAWPASSISPVSPFPPSASEPAKDTEKMTEQARINEFEKAALRRELMGSFLLE